MKKYEILNDLPGCKYLQSRLYEDKESQGLNEFNSRINEIYNDKFPKSSIKEQIQITLDYLKPFLKSGKLQTKISMPFKSRKEIGLYSKNIKTIGYKNLIISKLNSDLEDDFDTIFLGYEYNKDEIETFIEDVINIVLSISDRGELNDFYMYRIGFKIPEGNWLFV